MLSQKENGIKREKLIRAGGSLEGESFRDGQSEEKVRKWRWYLLWSETDRMRRPALSVQLNRKPTAVAAVLDALQSVGDDDRHSVVEHCGRG